MQMHLFLMSMDLINSHLYYNTIDQASHCLPYHLENWESGNLIVIQIVLFLKKCGVKKVISTINEWVWNF